MHRFLLTALVLSMAFANPSMALPDNDGDGYSAAKDCDDNDPDVNPGAAEIWYDGIDQNCDELNDFDQDQDAYVALGFEAEAGGSSPGTGDCDDLSALVNPGAEEDCNGVDDDCDDLIDGGDLDDDGTAAACGDPCFGEDDSGDSDGDEVCANFDCDDADPKFGECVFIDDFKLGGQPLNN